MRKIFKIAIMSIMLSMPVLAYDPFGFDLLASPYNYNPLNPTHNSILNEAMENNERNKNIKKESRGRGNMRGVMEKQNLNGICVYNGSYCYEDDLEDWYR